MRAVKLTILVLAVTMTGLWLCDAATTENVKLCGQRLVNIMRHICDAQNSSLSWDDDPSVTDLQELTRRKREFGDMCCTEGCNWAQLSEYCQ